MNANGVPRLAFNLSTGADTGGAAIREVEAFAARPDLAGDWTVRAMVAATNYIRYPEDLPYSVGELEAQYDLADVVHLNHTLHGHTWYDNAQGKPIVLEHHGLHKGSFDIDFEGSIVQGLEVGAVQIGSTVNLELFGPPGTIEWAPIPYDLAKMAEKRAKAVQNRLGTAKSAQIALRVGHSPTNRAIKGTQAFIDAMTSLRRRGFAVEAVLIEKKDHETCLAAKATCDLIVDQLELGYGCNAIEAWAMDIPVIGGVDTEKHPGWREHMQDRFQLTESRSGLPFYEPGEIGLENAILNMLDPERRRMWGDIGLAHVHRWHSQSFAVEQMRRIYDEARLRPTKPAPIGPTSRRRSYRGLPRSRRLELLAQAKAKRLGGAVRALED